MTDYSTWLNVPQTVVLEATQDIELALGLTSRHRRSHRERNGMWGAASVCRRAGE
jgi:hypothetical protein